MDRPWIRRQNPAQVCVYGLVPAHHKSPSLTCSLWRWKFRQKGLLSHSMMSLIVTFLLVTQLLSKICSFMPQSQCNPPGRKYPLKLSTFLQISLREKTMLSPQNGQWLYAFVSRTHDWLFKVRRVSDVSSSPRSSSQCAYFDPLCQTHENRKAGISTIERWNSPLLS